MRILPLSRGALRCFFLSLALAASFSHAEDKEVGVVGVGECMDCAQHNFDIKQAFAGLHVTIDCKVPGGHFKTRGKADLDEHGHFKVSLPKDIVKEECYAQLHSASSAPCPAHESLESSKVVLSQDETAQENTFGLPGNLKFSPITCASKTFWHHFHKHPFFHHPAPPKEEPKTPMPPAPKKEKPAPKPPAPKKEKPEPKKEPCPPKKEKPAPKKKPNPPKKEKPEIPPPTTPVVKPNPPETPTYKHPFFKHPFHNHPFFKHLPPFPTLPPHPFLPPHHP